MDVIWKDKPEGRDTKQKYCDRDSRDVLITDSGLDFKCLNCNPDTGGNPKHWRCLKKARESKRK